jgi:hypothetical protein
MHLTHGSKKYKTNTKTRNPTQTPCMSYINRTQWLPKCVMRPLPSPGMQDYLNLYCKTELIIILKLYKIDYSILCIAFRNTSLAAARQLRSVKSFLHSLHLCTVWSPTPQSAIVGFRHLATLSLAFLCPQSLSNWHSSPLHIHFQPDVSAASYCSIVARCCCVG